jgi:hypothetical protein
VAVPKPELDEAVGQRHGAGRAVGASGLRLPIDEVVSITEKTDRRRHEDRLVRHKRRQIADPGAANAQAEQHERQDAA